VALLLSDSIFALGVMVGKNLSPPPRSNAPAQALLDRLDAQADGGAVASDSLTFQDELTKKLAPAPPPKAAKQAAPAVPLPAAPVAAPPQAPSFAGPPPTAVAAALIDAGGAKSLVLSELTDRDSGVEVAVASKLPMIRVPPAPKSFFTVQVKATQSSSEADKFAKKLRGQGYQSLVAEAEVEGKGKWYRVRVGKFETRAQADHYLLDFKRETHLEAFVTAAGH
jgi:DedD protein